MCIAREKWINESCGFCFDFETGSRVSQAAPKPSGTSLPASPSQLLRLQACGFCGARHQTQDFKHTGQMLYQQSYNVSPNLTFLLGVSTT